MQQELDTDLLKTFVAIADAGSFTQAARQVHRTQSAVSMQMRRLEEVVDRTLFEREGRAMRLTREGEALLGYARRILSLNDEALAALAEPQIEGVVRLGAPDEYAMAFLPGILSSFARTHPRVEVELRCEPTVMLDQAFKDDLLDVAIVTISPELPADMTVLREPTIWASSPRHVVHELDPLPLAVFNPGCAFRRAGLDALDTMGRNYEIRYSSWSMVGLQTAAAAGLAVTVLSISTMPPTLRQLSEDEGFPALPWNEIGLRTSKKRLSAAGKSLTQHINQWFQPRAQMSSEVV